MLSWITVYRTYSTGYKFTVVLYGTWTLLQPSATMVNATVQRSAAYHIALNRNH